MAVMKEKNEHTVKLDLIASTIFNLLVKFVLDTSLSGSSQIISNYCLCKLLPTNLFS